MCSEPPIPFRPWWTSRHRWFRNRFEVGGQGARIKTLIETPDGSIAAVDPRRLAEIPFSLLTNPPNNSVAIPASSASIQRAMTVSGEGPCEVANFAHEQTGAALVNMQIQDGETVRGLMNGGIHIDTIFGSGQQPYWLPETLYLDELRSLIMTFTDISGAGNAVRPNFSAGRYLSLQIDPYMEKIRKRLEQRQYMAVPYFYTWDQGLVNGGVTVGALATAQFTITVGQSEHFQIHTLTGVQTSINYDINIVDTSRGESIIDAPNNTSRAVSAGLVVGTANFPFRFHTPRLIQIGQQLLVTLTDRSGAPNTIHLTLGGRAITDKMWR